MPNFVKICQNAAEIWWFFELSRWRPPSWKFEKPSYLSRVLTDFNEIWHTDAVLPSRAVRPLKMWNLKNLRWRRPPSWIIENPPYLGRVLTAFDQVMHGDAVRPSSVVRPLQIRNLKFPRWRRPPCWKFEKIATSRPRFILISIHTIQCRTRQAERRQKNIYRKSTKSAVKILN